MENNKFRSILIIFMFCGVITFPIINNYFSILKDSKNYENRKLADCPKFDIKHLDKFPQKYDAYYSDHFSIRSLLIEKYNLLNIELYKKSPLPNEVLIGKNGWLYYKGIEYDSYLGLNMFTNSELRSFKKELEYRKKYLAERNCKFYIVIVPNKALIYPFFIPNNTLYNKKQSQIEQLSEYLTKNSDLNLVNIYDALKNKAKDLKNPVFFKLDNHWNQLGSFYGSNEILKKIHQDFSDVKPSNLLDYKVSKQITRKGNIIDLFHFDHKFTDYNYIFESKFKSKSKSVFVPEMNYPSIVGISKEDFEVTKEIKGSNLPKLLFISDSFGYGLLPFLSEHFSRTERIFDAWEYKLNEKIVESEKPDIVVLVVSESYLRNILKYQSQH